MDEKNFKTAYQNMNPLPCVFRKAILSNKFGCEKFQRLNIAERESINCNSLDAHKVCTSLLNLLILNSQVALHLSDIEHQLPHNKAMQLQCGGLLGIRNALELTGKVINIYALIKHSLSEFQNLENLPYQNIVGTIIHYKTRKQR